MKRIVHGHYADPESTRDIIEISPDEFDAIKFSFKHQMKKMNAMKIFSDDDLQDMIAEQMVNATEYEMKTLQLLTPDSLRKSFLLNADLLNSMMTRMEKLEKKKTTTELKNLSFSDFAILIDAVRYACTDINTAINTDESVIREVVEQANIKSGFDLTAEKIEEGLDKVLGSGQDDYLKRAKVLYGILEQINTPYEGAVYNDRDGNQADTSPYFENKDKPPRTDIN